MTIRDFQSTNFVATKRMRESSVILLRLYCIAVQAILIESTYAATPCFDRGLAHQAGLVMNAATFTDRPTRRGTEDEYAFNHDMEPDVLKKKVAATGKLDCSAGISTANLVIKGDIVLASGHAVAGKKGCKKDFKDLKCTFEVPGQPPVPIAKVLDSGLKCPLRRDSGNDWAVLKLSRKITGVVPYKLAADPKAAIKRERKVVNVAAQSNEFKKADVPGGAPTSKRNMHDCWIKTIDPMSPDEFHTNCDSGRGSSGSALLDANLDEPTILGIYFASAETPEQGDEVARTGRPNEREYDQFSWYSRNVSITGDLYDALAKATK